jgi:lysophospholipase L1-like esterase
MRDRAHDGPRARLRLALVGDSFTQGLQVEDDQTVSRRLEQLASGGLEAFNFGVSSVGTSVELLLYRERVRPVRADVVVLLLFLGNDVTDNVPGLKQRTDPTMAQVSPYFPLGPDGVLTQSPVRGIALQSSRLGWLLKKGVLGQWVVWTTQVARLPGFNHEAPPAASTEEYPLLENAWSVTEQVLVRFHKEVLADRAQFILVVIPADMVAIDRGELDCGTRDGVARLEILARREGFPVLDLSTPFLEAIERGRGPLSYSCDPHWNAAGHNEAAKAILHFLRQRGSL